jgi:hypothetical protein
MERFLFLLHREHTSRSAQAGFTTFFAPWIRGSAVLAVQRLKDVRSLAALFDSGAPRDRLQRAVFCVS